MTPVVWPGSGSWNGGRVCLVGASLLLVATLPQAAWAGTRPRLLVLAFGADEEEAAMLERRLHEQLVANQNVEAVPPMLVAQALAPPAAAAPPQINLADEVDKLMAAAEDAYYGDRAADLSRILDAVDTLYTQHGGATTSEQARLLVWRTAAALAASKTRAAQNLARQALRNDPALVVDLAVMRPSVKTLLDETRRALGETYALELDIWPPSAVARLDGATLSGHLNVVAGEYLLEAAAPGFRTLSSTVRVPEVTRLRLDLPVDVSPLLSSKLEGATWRGDWAPADEQELTERFDALGVDCLATVSSRVAPRAERRALVRCVHGGARASLIFPATGQGDLELLSFIKETATALPLHPAAAAKPWQVIASVGVAAARAARSIDAAEGASVGTAHLGGTSTLAAELINPSGWLVDADLSLMILPSHATLELAAPQPPQRLAGGWLARSRLGVGYTGQSSIGDHVTRLAGTAGLVRESRATDDVALNGSRLGLQPSYQSWGVGVRLEGRVDLMPLSNDNTLSAALSLEGVPVRTWRESPDGATGETPHALPWFGWRAALLTRGRWFTGAYYEGSVGWVRFHGEATAPHPATLRAARVRETLHSLGFIAGLSV